MCALQYLLEFGQGGFVLLGLIDGVHGINLQSWACGVVVPHPLSMREALGSIPSVSTFCASSRGANALREILHVTGS